MQMSELFPKSPAAVDEVDGGKGSSPSNSSSSGGGDAALKSQAMTEGRTSDLTTSVTSNDLSMATGTYGDHCLFSG